MKNVKKIVAALLGICMAVSGFTLAACKKGNVPSGSNTDNTTDNTGNAGNTDKEPEKEPEPAPVVTTVANAEEWKAAFLNLFKADSFLGKSYLDSTAKEGNETSVAYTHSDNYVDFKKGQARCNSTVGGSYHGEHLNTGVDYDEIDGDSAYYYSKWNIWEDYQQPPAYRLTESAGKYDENHFRVEEEVTDYYLSGKTEIEKKEFGAFIFNNESSCFTILRNKWCTAQTLEDGKYLPELFAAFTYENGCYVSDTLGVKGEGDNGASVFAPCHLEVEIKNGLISKFEYTNTEIFENQETQEAVEYSSKVGFTIEGINSTTITLPDGAREAIDAEKHKPGNKPAEKPTFSPVADEAAWEAGLDIFSLDSFSYTCENADGYFDRTMSGVVDVANLKYHTQAALKINTAGQSTSTYVECENGIVWWWNSSANEAEKITVEQGSTTKDTLAACLTTRDSILALFLSYKYSVEANSTDGKTLSEFYTEFTYQDGYYVSQSLYQCEDGMPLTIKIAFADGVVSEIIFTFEMDGAQAVYTFEFYHINSSVVYAPSEARAVIDAEKAKG